jgi:hypothetical protein
MIACVIGLRKVGTREVLLAHVFHVSQVDSLYEKLKQSMLPKQKRQRSVLQQAGFDVAIKTPLGIPFYEINELAANFPSSLVLSVAFSDQLDSKGGSYVGNSVKT